MDGVSGFHEDSWDLLEHRGALLPEDQDTVLSPGNLHSPNASTKLDINSHVLLCYTTIQKVGVRFFFFFLSPPVVNNLNNIPK